MRYSTNKDLNRFICDLVRRGWAFTHGGKHDHLKAPNGRLLVISKTPSDGRSLKNAMRDARRAMQSP